MGQELDVSGMNTRSRKYEPDVCPSVSVVTPTYNRAHLLGKTIESILSQTFEDFELIVVSDGSTDNTQEVVASFKDPRLRYLEQENSGFSSSPRNQGIKVARGGLIAFCDDDDLWHPGKLKAQVEVFERDPSLGLCYTDVTCFNDHSSWNLRGKVRQVDFNDLIKLNRIPCSSVMVRRSIFAEVGFFNEGKEFASLEDYEMWLRIAYRHKIQFINFPFIHCRVQEKSLTKPAYERLDIEKMVLFSVCSSLDIDKKRIDSALLMRDFRKFVSRLVGTRWSSFVRLYYSYFGHILK